jgi:dTDP-4-amino-4,6-dideoxygalactose transaminase
VQIDELEKFIDIKIRNYERYKKGIEEIDGLEIMPFQHWVRPNHWFYSILIDEEKYGLNKDELLIKLNEAGIQSRPIWGLIYRQKPYINSEAYMIERADYYGERILNIPCSTNLTEREVDIVIDKLKEFKK